MPVNETVRRFQPGDILTVKPADEDDPLAEEMTGRHCRLVRTIEFSGHCLVEFREGTRMHFRPQDLERESEER
jgi:hypothetical protein